MSQKNNHQNKENRPSKSSRRKFIKNLGLGALTLAGGNIFSRVVKAKDWAH